MSTIQDLVKRLYIRFEVLWGDKHTSRFTNETYINIWMEDWCEGLKGINPAAIKDALVYCRANLEWPPSLAEFIKLCEKSLNLPSPEECMRLAIRKEFTHPLVKIIYDKVGSWDFSHDSEKTLLKKITQCHKEEISKLRIQNSSNENLLVQEREQERININHDKGGVRKATDYLLQ